MLTGGRSRPDVGPYVYEPTVLAGVTAAMDVRDEETFGPVVTIYRVGSDEEAIRLANDTDYGLNASGVHRDVRRGRRIAAAITRGRQHQRAYGAAWGSVAAPMGGMKASGLSRRHGAEGILKYTESQTVSAQHVVPLAPFLGMSDETVGARHDRALRALKAGGAGDGLRRGRGRLGLRRLGRGLRLAEKGYRVHVIESGRRFADQDFAKTSWDVRRYLWAPRLKCFGVQRIHRLRTS